MRQCLGEFSPVSADPQPPGDPGKGITVPRFIWLIVALIPGAVGLLRMAPGTSLRAELPVLMILNLALSGIGTVGLIRGREDRFGLIFFGIFLTGFFFVLNCSMVVYASCSGMGSI